MKVLDRGNQGNGVWIEVSRGTDLDGEVQESSGFEQMEVLDRGNQGKRHIQ